MRMSPGGLTVVLALCTVGAARADGELPCAHDDALARAAAELLLAARPPEPEALDGAVRAAGSDLVGVRALFQAVHDAAQARAWIEGVTRRADAPVVCGHALGASGALVIAASRAGTLAPVTVHSTHVRGALAEGFTDAEIVVSDADERLQRLPVDADALAEGIAIADDLARPARVQLVATGVAGPRPVAERTIPAPTVHAAVGVDDDPVPRGSPVLEQLGALRAGAARPSVRENRLLAAVASEHAAKVCAEGRVAHELGAGDPEARLRLAGIEARVVGETVARADGEDQAFAAMRRSPSHRMTLLDARFTHAGAGTAKDARGRACLVVLLAAWPRYVGR